MEDSQKPKKRAPPSSVELLGAVSDSDIGSLSNKRPTPSPTESTESTSPSNASGNTDSDIKKDEGEKDGHPKSQRQPLRVILGGMTHRQAGLRVIHLTFLVFSSHVVCCTVFEFGTYLFLQYDMF